MEGKRMLYKTLQIKCLRGISDKNCCFIIQQLAYWTDPSCYNKCPNILRQDSTYSWVTVYGIWVTAVTCVGNLSHISGVTVVYRAAIVCKCMHAVPCAVLDLLSYSLHGWDSGVARDKMTNRTPSSRHNRTFNKMLQKFSKWEFQKVPETLLAAPAVHRLIDKHYLYA